MKYLLTFLVAVFFFWPGYSEAQSTPTGPDQRLCWDHDGQRVAGFKLLYGPSSGQYDQTIDVGMAQPGSDFGHTQGFCSKTFKELGVVAGDYYWNVVAYNVVGMDSAPDGEVTTIPLVLAPPSPATGLTVAPN